MMEGRQHNNPWAEKLSQLSLLSLPDSGPAWQAMEARLDKEMPRDGRRDKRRWLLLVVVLLLLIGVCHCPGRGRFAAFTSQWRSPKAIKAVPLGDKITHGPLPQGSGDGHPLFSVRTGSDSVRGGNPAAMPGASVPPVPREGPAPGQIYKPADPGAAVEPMAPGSHAVTPGRKLATPDTPFATPARGRRVPTKKIIDQQAVTNVIRRGHSGHHGRLQPADHTLQRPGHPGQDIDDDAEIIIPRAYILELIPELVTDTAWMQDKVPPPPVKKKPMAGDSSRKKPPVQSPDRKPKENENGWMVAVGLNQFFPIGGQQSAYNSGGTSGNLQDYIPVPVLRYYFNRKWYIQLEGQFNTPQATRKNLVISSPLPDTATVPGTTIQRSASIQKLFYFNLPISLHYSPVKSVYIGAGLQFSRLTNAVGTFDSTAYATFGALDTVNSKVTRSFKGDSLYQQIKTSELRVLLDASYTYKHFILGLRYNQALSRFVDIRLSSGQITQARNSSLQLYLRYILWNNLKRSPIQTK